MTTDGSTPGTSINAAGPEATLTVTDMPEGRNVVKARAISGAGVPAADSDIGATEIDVDKTAPESVARRRAGPDAMEAEPPECALGGVDQANLSGMRALTSSDASSGPEAPTSDIGSTAESAQKVAG